RFAVIGSAEMTTTTKIEIIDRPRLIELNPFRIEVADQRRTYACHRHNQQDFRYLSGNFRGCRKSKPAQIFSVTGSRSAKNRYEGGPRTRNRSGFRSPNRMA